MANPRIERRPPTSVKRGLEEALGPFRKPHPFTKLRQELVESRWVKVEHLPRNLIGPQEQLRLALISFPDVHGWGEEKQHKSVSKTVAQKLPDVYREECKRRLFPIRKSRERAWTELYVQRLRSTLEQYQPHVVCVNEMAFPTSGKAPSVAVRESVRSFSEKHKCLIVSGSCHDERTLYNTAHVFYPGCAREGDLYHKHVSAWKVGEVVNVPPIRKTPIYEAFGLTIGLAVCLDVFSFSTIGGIADLTPSLLLLPAHTSIREKMSLFCKSFSLLVGGAVAVVYQATTDEISNHLCIDGEYVPTANRTPNQDDGTEVSVHSLSVNDLIARAGSGKREPAMDWLFGAVRRG